MTARNSAVAKLIAIHDAANHASGTRLAAITALGRAGGTAAVAKLIAIHDAANHASNTRLTAIAALGEAARVD